MPVNPEIVEQVLRDYDALRQLDADHQLDADPQLEAVRVAILLEDVFGVTLSDAEIDPAVLADTSAVAALIAGLQGTA
jgi:hypothetical protein